MNIFMHRKNAKSERELIGDQMNCNDEQTTMIGALPTGQAVVRSASSSKPVRVQINNPLEAVSSKGPVTDAHIRKHMEPIFKSNPHFREYRTFTRQDPEINSVNRAALSMELDILCILRVHIIAEHPTFLSMQKVLIEVTQGGSSLLAAYIIRSLGQLATKEDATLPLCCLRLLHAYSCCDDPMPKEVADAIISELAKLVSIDEGLLTIEIETLHERLDIECADRVDYARSEEEKTGALISKAVNRAIAEFKQRPQQKPPIAIIPFNLESDLSRIIEGIVTTDEFAKRYVERMEKAAGGDIDPLVRLVTVFSKRLLGPDCTLAEVSSSLLHYARTAHKTPEDDAVWNKVFMEVQSKIIEQGFKVAT
jgi:hypothetical protein